MTSIVFFLILLFAGCVWYLGAPLYGSILSPKNRKNKPLEDLNLRKEEVLATLKELELDHRTKKITDEDFKSVYAETFEKGKILIKQIEDLEVNSVEEARAPVFEKTSQPKEGGLQPKYCHQCGGALISGAKFCSQCGVKIV